MKTPCLLERLCSVAEGSNCPLVREKDIYQQIHEDLLILCLSYLFVEFLKVTAVCVFSVCCFQQQNLMLDILYAFLTFQWWEQKVDRD